MASKKTIRSGQDSGEDTAGGVDPTEPDADDRGQPNSSAGAAQNSPGGNVQNNAPNHTQTPVHHTVPRHDRQSRSRRGA